MTFSSFYVENKRLCAKWDLKQKRKVFYSHLKNISPGIAMAALALAPSTAFSGSFYENGSRAKAKTTQFSVLVQPKTFQGLKLILNRMSAAFVVLWQMRQERGFRASTL